MKKKAPFFIKSWAEDELTYSGVKKTLNIILGTEGCFWAKKGGCTMCGYDNDSPHTPFVDMTLFEAEVQKHEGLHSVKIFTSGSFLDQREVPIAMQQKIIDYLTSINIDEISIESRPEFIRKSTIEVLHSFPRLKEVSIGLETSSDRIRDLCIKKGFSFEQFCGAAKLLKDEGIKVKAYVLIKPPFLYESDAIKDAVATAEAISDYVDTISFNPVVVMKNTLLSRLFPKSYLPPSLFSVHRVIERTISLKNRILCDIMGKYSKRGAHNCKKCDKSVIESIQKMILTKTPSELPKCSCFEKYRAFIENERSIPLSYDRTFQRYL